MRTIHRSPTAKSVGKLNHSQDPLLILTPPSSLREISHSFRLNRHITLQSKKNKGEEFDDIPQHQYRNQLQKLYQESFIKQLLEKVVISNRLNNYQKQVLDDLHFGQDTQIDDIDNFCYKFMFNYFKHYPLIQPQSYFKLITDIIYLLITFIIFIWLPFKYSFNYDNIHQFINLEEKYDIEYTFIVLQLIEMIVQLNLASINNGKIINQRYHIIYNYIKQNLVKDILSLLSLIFLLFNNLSQSIIIIIFMILYFYIESEKIYIKLQSIQNILNTQQLIILLFNFLIIIYLIHIISCIQYILVDQINEKTAIEQYLECFHWSSVYLTSAGLTTIKSENNSQLIFSSFVSLLSLLINGYVTIKIGFYIYEETQQLKQNKFLQMMNKYMYHNKISINLQNRIRSYLQYIYKQEKQMEDEDVTIVVNKLSLQLKNELKYQLQANLLEQCTLISQNFSKKLRKQLIYYMEEIKTVPEQRILTLNEVDDSSIYLINKGEVNIVFERKDNMNERYIRNHIKTLSKGEFFGFYGFISGNARTSSIISKGFCQLYKIQRIHFINLLEQFPDDKEVFCMIRDNVEINKDLSNLKIKCYSCKSNQHLVNQCPYLHFNPDHDRVIKQQLYPIEQDRDDIQRKSKYINALLQKNMIADVARQIIQDIENPQQSEEEEDITETESEENRTKTIKSTSNLQTKSLSKSMSQYSVQMSRLSHRPSQTLTIPLTQTQNQLSLKSQEDIGRFEQEILRKMSLHKRSQQQKETAGFGARFESQMHNPIMENDEEIPNIDTVDEDVQPKQQEIQKHLSYYNYQDRSPRIYRRVSQRVQFDSNLFGNKYRRSSLMYEQYVSQLNEESFHEIEFPLLTQPSIGEFDKIQEFRKYYPQYNITWVMKMLKKYNQTYQNTKASLYSFLNIAIIKGQAIKNKLNSLSRYNIRINAVNSQKKIYKKNKIKTMLL